MNEGKYVFAQVMEHLPLSTFHRCVVRYSGEHKVKRFSCLDQYLSMAFAQLTYRESLRDIEACLRTQSTRLCHLGFRSSIARNTLANANATRDWRIYCDFAQSLIGIARRLYADEAFGLDLKDTVYALDATTIDLCLSVFAWAPFRSTKAAVKLHTLLDLRGNRSLWCDVPLDQKAGLGRACVSGSYLATVEGVDVFSANFTPGIAWLFSSHLLQSIRYRADPDGHILRLNFVLGENFNGSIITEFAHEAVWADWAVYEISCRDPSDSERS